VDFTYTTMWDFDVFPVCALASLTNCRAIGMHAISDFLSPTLPGSLPVADWHSYVYPTLWYTTEQVFDMVNRFNVIVHGVHPWVGWHRFFPPSSTNAEVPTGEDVEFSTIAPTL
jgi:hypothetical protein